MSLIFEKSKKGKRAVKFSDENLEPLKAQLPLKRQVSPVLPEVSELDVARHYTNLSAKNFSIEKGFYPLGSCTMKYNPKINEEVASLDGFTNLHPAQKDEDVQGVLELLYDLSQMTKAITGMDYVTLQPAAGAHGEYVGMLMTKAYFDKKGETRTKVICPDSAHGTNPATAKMCGFEVVEIPSNDKGQVDVEVLKEALKEDVAAFMMTNPNTLGLFEEDIAEIAKIVHKNGSLLYYDGANLNAIMGITNPKLMGFDIVHLNYHKTLSTPHGGGGPGAGCTAVVERLKEFLPTPLFGFDGEKYFRDYSCKNSIGKVKAFYGNIGVLIRAYTYILMMGKTGIKMASQDAVLNANYMKEKLKKYYDLAYDIPCMHEFVLSGNKQKEQGVNTFAIAKKLIDEGYHPPTVYFPLIVSEAIMIEPTETESKETLDEFIDVMIQIDEQVKINPQEILKSPVNTPVKKVDETLAARKPNLRYKIDE